MMEFMHSAHPDAHFRATDSDESPGRVAPHRMSGAPIERADHNLDIPG
jgi:hypothetical protein